MSTGVVQMLLDIYIVITIDQSSGLWASPAEVKHRKARVGHRLELPSHLEVFTRRSSFLVILFLAGGRL